MNKKELEQLFKEIEVNLVTPFEGTITHTDLKTPEEMHKKILDYNRTAFNRLRNKYIN